MTVQRDASDLDVADGSPHIVSSLGNLLPETGSWINGGTTSTHGSSKQTLLVSDVGYLRLFLGKEKEFQRFIDCATDITGS